jgi:hypothetical protein
VRKKPVSLTIGLALALTGALCTPGVAAGALPGLSGVSGHVTGQGGAGLAGVCVSVRTTSNALGPAGTDTLTDANGDYDAYLGTTDGAGVYTVTFVPWAYGSVGTPDHRVVACPGTSGNYAAQCYNAKHYPSCDAVTVNAGAYTTGIDATLAVGGRISGHVRDERGAPLAGIKVDLIDSLGTPPQSNVRPPGVTTDASGNYTISELATGTYGIVFADPSGRYEGQVYKGRKCAGPCLSDPISVTEGSATTGIDSVMLEAFAGLDLGSKPLIVGKKGTVQPLLHCTALVGDCAGRDTLKTAGPVTVSAAVKRKRHKRRRVLRLGSGRFSIPALASRKVTIKLSKAALKLLAKKHRLKVLEIAVAHDSRGTLKTTTASVTLKKSKK